MSPNSEAVPLRTRLRVETTNFLQKYRTILIGTVGAAVVIVAGLAIWTQVDLASRNDFAAKIEKSQLDYANWQTESDAAKKADLAKTLETELAAVQKSAPQGYGLSKAWFLQGNYEAYQKKWKEAAQAYRTAYEKDVKSYLAPISLVNQGVSLEEANDTAGALAVYAEFEKAFSADAVLGPQVLFSQGRLLEATQKTSDALAKYKTLLDKYPDSSWTKLGRDRILLLSQE